MSQTKIHLPSKKLLVGWSIVIFCLIFGWYLLLAMTFSASDIRARTLATLSENLGAPVTALEGQSFSLMPIPRMVLSSVQVKNHPKSRHPSMLSASTLVIRPSLASMFGDLVVDVTFMSPKMEFETFADRTHSWNLPEELKVTADPNQPKVLIRSLVFNRSKLHYSNESVERDITLDPFTFSLNFQSTKDYSLQGRFRYLRDDFNIAFDAASDGTREVKLSNVSTSYHLQGKWDEQADTFTGQQVFETKDLGHLLEALIVSGEHPSKIAEGEATYPLNMTSQVKLKGKRLTVSEIKIEGEEVAGEGQAVGLIGDVPELNTQLDLAKFSMDRLHQRHLFDELITNRTAKKGERNFNIAVPGNRKISLPTGINMTLSVKSKEAALANIDVSKMQFSARLSRGVLEIAQLSGLMENQGQFLLKGRVEGTYDGLAFKGGIDLAGQEFAKTFSPYFVSANPQAKSIVLPDTYKRFRARANLFMNPAVMRVSDMILRVDDRQLLGTLVRQRLKKAQTTSSWVDKLNETRQKNQARQQGRNQPTNQEKKHAERSSGYRYEGAFRAHNVNLDQWWKSQFNLTEESEGAAGSMSQQRVIEQIDGVMKALGGSLYNMKISLVDATLDGQERDPINFRIALNGKRLTLDDLQISYNNSAINGNAELLLAKDKKPHLKTNMQLDRLDTAMFFGSEYLQSASMWMDERGAWSLEEFDILWLNDMDVDVQLRIGDTRHQNYQARQLDAKFDIQDGRIKVDHVKAQVWRGELSASGRVMIGKLPTVTGTVTVNQFDFKELHPIYPVFSTLHGFGNLKGDFSTTGVNPHSMVKNLDGAISFAGSQMKIIGFNLANMVRAANAVRKVEDIDKLIEFANRGGETLINTIQGNLNVGDGFVRTPVMKISTPVGEGTIKGQLNLMNEEVNAAITIFLAALSERDPPNIRLVFVGPLQQVKRSLDTQVLESFVAKQAAERLLVNP